MRGITSDPPAPPSRKREGDNDLPMNATTSSDDREMVSRLLQNDQAAWRDLLAGVATPIVRERKYREMLSRHALEPEDLLQQLCEELCKDNFAKLRAFRFDCSLTTFLYWQVKGIVGGITRSAGWGRESLPTGEASIEEISDARSSGSDAPASDPGARVSRKEEVSAARMMITRLWEENPEGAYALLLKAELDVPSATVAALLGKKQNTVDQLVSRARRALRESPNR